MKTNLFFAALLLSTATIAQATVVVEERDGAQVASGSFYWGVSFTTPTGSSWNDISINFYDALNNNLAGGNGFLFAAPYAGSPNGLAGSGALAVASSVSNLWNFATNFQIASSTQYFFYSDALLAPLLGNAAAPGESYFFTASATGGFIQAAGNNINFTVNGLGAVPEPATWLMLILGFGTVGAGMRRAKGVRTSVAFA